jgi:tight adherence protein C
MVAMTYIWTILAIMLIGLSFILFWMARQDATAPETEKRFSEALEGSTEDGWLNQRRWRSSNSLTSRFKRALEKTPGTDMQEVETLMRQASLVDEQTRSMVYASLWATPLLGVALAFLVATSNGGSVIQYGLFGFCIGFIVPRKALRWIAERRKEEIREEMPIVLNLMRLLFDAGLSLEHTLKAINEQGRQIAPNLADEFNGVLMRIQHGQDRGAALDEMARRLDVPELTETVAILKQAARYGGSLRESLLRYLRLMEDRRMTELRDKVGKMSAKMTVVMVTFMFPALMIFLAGPGFLALIRALSTV